MATTSFLPIEEFQKRRRVLPSAFICGFLIITPVLCKEMGRERVKNHAFFADATANHFSRRPFET
jgi:hypothetical protein